MLFKEVVRFLEEGAEDRYLLHSILIGFVEAVIASSQPPYSCCTAYRGDEGVLNMATSRLLPAKFVPFVESSRKYIWTWSPVSGDPAA